MAGGGGEGGQEEERQQQERRFHGLIVYRRGRIPKARPQGGLSSLGCQPQGRPPRSTSPAGPACRCQSEVSAGVSALRGLQDGRWPLPGVDTPGWINSALRAGMRFHLGPPGLPPMGLCALSLSPTRPLRPRQEGPRAERPTSRQPPRTDLAETAGADFAGSAARARPAGWSCSSSGSGCRTPSPGPTTSTTTWGWPGDALLGPAHGVVPLDAVLDHP